MNRGVEGARDDEHAELGDGNGQCLGAGDFSGSADELRLEHPEEIDRVALVVAVGGHVAESSRERPHRAQPRVLRGGRKRPRVPEGHRAEARRLPATVAAHPTPDVQDRDPIDGTTAELVRRAVLEVFELVTDFQNTDVVGSIRDHGGSRPETRRGQRKDRCGARLTQQGAPRNTTGAIRHHRRRYTAFATAVRDAASLKMPRMYSAASLAFRSAKSSPTGFPSTFGMGWHNS